MTTELIAVLELGNVLVAGAGFVAGAVFSYLFLRANPKKKAAVDTWTNEQSDNLKK
jgi:hypothetical protein